MSVAGLDFGNLSLVIAQTSKGGVDVLLNEASSRQTSTTVSIQGKQRFIGDSGAAMAKSNIKNTVSLMKLLVGRKFDDVGVQQLLSKLPYETVRLSCGGIGIQISYDNEQRTIPAEHFMAMMLTRAKLISAAANNQVNIGDAVLAVPHWFTESQRRGILQACEIASLNCLKVANESTSIALSYGIFKSAKKLFSETEPTHVMFIDIGYTGYCVSIVDFIQENMKVLSTVCDREVCGRAFDDVIIEYIAERFETKYKINARTNKKAMLKMQAAAEKAKKTLSPAGVNEVNISVECLAEDFDLSCHLTRDEFESRSAHIIAKLAGPIEQALSEAGLTKEQINEVEVVGGSTRVNVVKRTLGEILGLDASALNYGLKTTMNADEAVARGNALQCAMLSSRMKVKPFNIVDRMAYGVVAHYDSPAVAGGDGEAEEASSKGTCAALYVRGDENPRKPRRLTFRDKTSDFVITLTYDDAATAALPEGESKFLGRYTIKVPERPADAPPSDVRVTFHVDKNGCVFVQSAILFEEVIVTPEEEAAAAEAASKAGDEKKDEGKGGEEKDAAPKKKYKKTDLQVIAELPGLTSADMKASLEFEASMSYEDRLITETADKRNELESYIYAMRDKLDLELKEYVNAADKEAFKSAITEAEDWLYGDGFDSTKQEYTRRIDALRVLGDPIEKRLNESNNRGQSIDNLKKQIEHCKAFTSKYTEDNAHITEDERDKVRQATNATEDWMYDMVSKQGDLPLNVNPVLTVDGINAKRNELHNLAKPIMTKPKPAPAPVPPPPEPTPNSADAKEGESKNQEGKEGGDGEPMDQAKGGPDDTPQEK